MSDTAELERRAVEGCSQAQYQLGEYYANCYQQYGRAVEWWEKSALQMHEDAVWMLASSYFHGMDTQRDYFKAVEWFKVGTGLLCLSGASYCALGYCYERGLGVELDDAKAEECYENAVLQGFCAESFLSYYICLDGRFGVVRDPETEQIWFCNTCQTQLEQAAQRIADKVDRD